MCTHLERQLRLNTNFLFLYPIHLGTDLHSCTLHQPSMIGHDGRLKQTASEKRLVCLACRISLSDGHEECLHSALLPSMVGDSDL